MLLLLPHSYIVAVRALNVRFVLIQVLLIQIKCFNEIITIGYAVYKSHDLPWFRTLSWYLLISSNYFLYGESMIETFGVLLSRTVS